MTVAVAVAEMVHHLCPLPSSSSAVIIMIEIHLTNGESEIPFLSIPLSDVQRLSIRPFKWLRYVMFSICGARGELSAGPTFSEVDYETTALVDDSIYYYFTLGKGSFCI